MMASHVLKSNKVIQELEEKSPYISFSTLNMPNATEKILLFPSREIADDMTPPYDLFKW